MSSPFIRLFLSICLAISSAHSQKNDSEWNSQQLKTELLKLNEKLNYFSHQIQNLKMDQVSSSKNHLPAPLDRFEPREDELRNQIQTLKQQLGEMKSLSSERKNEMKNMKKELSELNKKGGALEKSVSLTQPYIYFQYFDEYNKKMEPDFVWTINDLRTRVNSTLLSEVFPLKAYSFGAQLELRVADNSINCSLAYKDLKESGKLLNIKPGPAVWFTLKDLSTPDHLSRIGKVSRRFHSVNHYDAFLYIASFNSNSTNNISFEIHVEPQQVTKQGYSYDGSLSWAIHDFRLKREMEREELVNCQISPYFYTSPKGYRCYDRK